MILLTGATGFVGKRVLKQLLASGQKVVCIARTPQKIEDHKNLTVLKGDLENSEIFSGSCDTSSLAQVDRVLHMAALYDLDASASACYMANVVATMNLLALTRRMPKFESFYYVSTVAIAGNYAGVVARDEIELGQSFANQYAKTKAQSEALLKRSLKPEQLCVLRPGIIVGDSYDGVFDKVDGPYLAIEFFKRLAKKMPLIKRLPVYPLPMDEKAQLPIVPVDVVAQILSQAILQRSLRGTHHLVTPDAPTVGEFAREMFKRLGYTGRLKPLAGADALSGLLKHLPPIEVFPTAILDYMASQARYDVTEESRLFPVLKERSWTEFQDCFFRQALHIL